MSNKYVTVPTTTTTIPEGKIVIANSGNSNVNISVGK